MNRMLLLPQDLALLAVCVLAPVLFEVLRVFLGYILAGPSSKIAELEKEKVVVQIELRSIKSVQLELVRNSKLERKVIKIDKEIEGIKALQEPKIAKTKKMLRFARAAVYLAIILSLSGGPAVLVSPSVLWPFSWVSSETTMPLAIWFLVPVSGGAARHLLRSVLPLLAPASSLP